MNTQTDTQKKAEPAFDWKARGWKSEEEWRQAQARAIEKHKRQASAAGIPWRAR